MIQLDTSFLIRALVEGSDESTILATWIAGGESLGICAPAWAELMCGPLQEADVAAAVRLLGPAIPFGPDEATVTARLFNASGRRRGSLIDCMVAASALIAGALLATSNPGDFKRFASSGLQMAAASSGV